MVRLRFTASSRVTLGNEKQDAYDLDHVTFLLFFLFLPLKLSDMVRIVGWFFVEIINF